MSCDTTKIRKNDQVRILTGKDKHKQGRVLRVDREDGTILIEGLNLVKKTMKKRKQNDKGGIAQVEAPVHISNVKIVCRKCGPVRAGYAIRKDRKVRVCKKCGDEL
jgi:large subunit ribosomal protein L24